MVSKVKLYIWLRSRVHCCKNMSYWQLKSPQKWSLCHKTCGRCFFFLCNFFLTSAKTSQIQHRTLTTSWLNVAFHKHRCYKKAKYHTLVLPILLGGVILWWVVTTGSHTSCLLLATFCWPQHATHITVWLHLSFKHATPNPKKLKRF